MTTGNGAGNELIDQAFFSFTRVEGLTIVASSLPNDDHERKWHALLRNHVRMKAHEDIPPHAMSYFLISSEFAVVLRRVNRGDSGGRNNSHALIGSPQILTSPVALGLELWTGWQEDPPTDRKMSQLHTSQLNCEVDPAAEFRAQVRKNPLHLEQVLGWLLQKPNDPLSIIGCPQEERIALLWGLMEIGEPLLKAAGKHRDWTFSTYEVDHGDASLPKIVCLPARPAGASVAQRTAVDLTGGGNPVDSRAAKRAHELVDRYLRDPLGSAEPETVDPVQPESTVPRHAQPDHLLQSEPPAPQTGPQTFGHAVSAASAHGTAAGAATFNPARHAELVNALMSARTPQDFESRLVAIEGEAGHPFARQQFRGELDKVDYAIKKVSQLIVSTERETTFKRLIVVTFGPSLQDFNSTEVRQYAARLIDNIPSNDFARTLCHVITMHNRHEEIAPLLTRRRLVPQKSTDPDQIEDNISSGGVNERLARRIDSARKTSIELSRKNRRFIVTSGAIAAVVFGFVVGMLVSSIFADSSPEASPTEGVSTEGGTGPAVVERPTLTITGITMDKNRITQVNVTPRPELPADRQLWLLVEQGGLKFPQPTPCTRNSANWECKQAYNFPGATGDYRLILVIADNGAANALGREYTEKYRKDAPPDMPGNGIAELPGGATETDLILTLSPVATSGG